MLKRWAVAASIGLLVAAGNGVAQEGDTGAVQAAAEPGRLWSLQGSPRWGAPFISTWSM